jgi:hypothetical protein
MLTIAPSYFTLRAPRAEYITRSYCRSTPSSDFDRRTRLFANSLTDNLPAMNGSLVDAAAPVHSSPIRTLRGLAQRFQLTGADNDPGPMKFFLLDESIGFFAGLTVFVENGHEIDPLGSPHFAFTFETVPEPTSASCFCGELVVAEPRVTAGSRPNLLTNRLSRG